MSDDDVQTVVTHDDLVDFKQKFQGDLIALREQISILQARAAALEAQLARIEPMVEARSSRTERLVMELQIEIQKLARFITVQEEKENTSYAEIKSMLQTLIERE